MTHDELLELLAGEGAWAPGDGPPGGGGGPRPGAEALAHARDCSECRDLLDALALAAADEGALVPPAPEGYWSDFDARLAARLERMRRRRTPSARTRTRAWLLAAAAAAACALGGVAAWRATRGPAPAFGSVAVEPREPSEIIAAAPAREVEAAAASLGVTLEGSASVDQASPDEPPVLAPADALDASGDLGDPLGAIESELAGSLDADAQRELARRLKEASS